MVIKCVFYVESAYPHFVTAGLCWPDPAKIPDPLICQIILRKYISAVVRPHRAQSPKIAIVIYTRKFYFCLISWRNSSFALSSFVLVSERNVTPTSVWYLICVYCMWDPVKALFLKRYTCHCETSIAHQKLFCLISRLHRKHPRHFY